MMLLSSSVIFAQCDYQIELTDPGYGDGWNGGRVTVYVNGVAVLTDITLNDGYGPEYHTFAVPTNGVITTDYTPGGWSYENHYNILDPNGVAVFLTGHPYGEPQDLLHFGLIPEFVGRLPVITALRKLTTEELVDILTKPKNAMVKQYQKLLSMNDVKLKITKDGLVALAEEAERRGTGARALRSIFEKLMLDVMYEIPSREDVESVTINRAVVLGKKPPVIRKKNKEDAA